MLILNPFEALCCRWLKVILHIPSFLIVYIFHRSIHIQHIDLSASLSAQTSVLHFFSRRWHSKTSFKVLKSESLNGKWNCDLESLDIWKWTLELKGQAVIKENCHQFQCANKILQSWSQFFLTTTRNLWCMDECTHVPQQSNQLLWVPFSISLLCCLSLMLLKITT